MAFLYIIIQQIRADRSLLINSTFDELRLGGWNWYLGGNGSLREMGLWDKMVPLGEVGVV